MEIVPFIDLVHCTCLISAVVVTNHGQLPHPYHHDGTGVPPTVVNCLIIDDDQNGPFRKPRYDGVPFVIYELS